MAKIRFGKKHFNTDLLIDSGADYSMMRRDVAEHLGVNLDILKPDSISTGISGKSIPVSTKNFEIEFGTKGRIQKETIPFRIPLVKNVNPEYPIIGRDPFFSRYRIDFRMGFTDDPSLGKFMLYPETKKRPAKKYGTPRTVGKKIK